MAKEIAYRSTDHNQASAETDPFLRPSFSLRNRLRRALWNVSWLIFYRFTPRPMHGWRAMVLRAFGAKIGPNPRIYAKVTIHSPWNLTCGELVAIADDVEVYNPAPLYLGDHAILSQGSYICGATHDIEDAKFPLLAMPMRIEAYAWVCARACVSPGVNMGEGSVLALGSIAIKNLEPWTVYGGNPAVMLKKRTPFAKT